MQVVLDLFVIEAAPEKPFNAIHDVDAEAQERDAEILLVDGDAILRHVVGRGAVLCPLDNAAANPGVEQAHPEAIQPPFVARAQALPHAPAEDGPQSLLGIGALLVRIPIRH
eukprot:scaffold447_cov307-Pinguiococcus_pyrenoidosus.AAC.93